MSSLAKGFPSGISTSQSMDNEAASSAYSRRAFLSTVSLAVAGIAINTRSLSAAELARGVAPGTLFPDPLDATLLQSLATRAVDAARSAGATYADVRVG